jgi:hypothetical protein
LINAAENKVTIWFNAMGKGKRAERVVVDRYPADNNSAGLQRLDQKGGDQTGQFPRDTIVSGADIDVRESRIGAEACDCRRQGAKDIPRKESIRRRYARPVSGQLAVEDVDVARWQCLAKMIVRTAVAEAELQHVSRQGADKPGSIIEAGTLRLHPADKRIESAHGSDPNRERCPPAKWRIATVRRLHYDLVNRCAVDHHHQP